MKKISGITQVVIGFAALGAIAVFQGCAAAPQANDVNSPSVGMGDVHLVESELIPVTGPQNSVDAQRWEAIGEYYKDLKTGNFQRARAADLARWVAIGEYYSKTVTVGMGDVHLAEGQQPIAVTGLQNSVAPYKGMGDWKRFEAQQEQAALRDTADQASGHTYFGTGDPIRFRATGTPKIEGQPNPGMGDLHLSDEGKGR